MLGGERVEAMLLLFFRKEKAVECRGGAFDIYVGPSTRSERCATLAGCSSTGRLDGAAVSVVDISSRQRQSRQLDRILVVIKACPGEPVRSSSPTKSASFCSIEIECFLGACRVGSDAAVWAGRLD